MPRIAILFIWMAAGHAQSIPAGTQKGEWPAYAGDLRNFHYSPLDQISATNFNQLEIAWRFKTDNLGNRPKYKFEGERHPLYDRRFAPRRDRARHRDRRMLWVHGEAEGARGAAAPRQLSGRGVSYWTDGKEERILYVTPGYRLVCLNCENGSAHLELRSGRQRRHEAVRGVWNRPADRSYERRDRPARDSGRNQERDCPGGLRVS